MKHHSVTSPFVWQPSIDSSSDHTTPCTGPLAGRRLAVKDLFDIKGTITTAGNPDWAAQQTPATTTAEVVSRLLDQGAVLVGKTITDEIAYSLNGQNIHYGTPINPTNPERLPGGSSSGSAVAVAADLADIGLGTDTGGSIRIPASYNGLFGLRPTHNSISVRGLTPLAPDFDTVGWMTKTLADLKLVAKVLLPTISPLVSTPKLGVATTMFGVCEHEHLVTSWLKNFTNAPKSITEIIPKHLDASESFRICQGHQIWQQYGHWITTKKPKFADDIEARLNWCKTITDAQLATAQSVKKQLISSLDTIFNDLDVIIIPTTPGKAPLLETSDSELANYRNNLLAMTALAGLAGLPQLHLPLFKLEGAPCGVSLLGKKHSEHQLIAVAESLLEIPL
jgi:Asp-tRNA(Asn)/Glu-tRNA(Gln) amidotransferase A subunit family amidase